MTNTNTAEPIATIWLEDGIGSYAVAAWQGPLSACRARLYAMVAEGLDVHWNAEPSAGQTAPINGYRL